VYFSSADSSIKFVHSGCTVLDCVLGGGWPLGRVVNVVGDRSAGKTLLAIELMVNFAHQYSEGKIRYRESEAAFSLEYAGALGLPLDRVEFTRNEQDGSEVDTVERFYHDLEKFLKRLNGQPGLYVLDSLDAISDEAEMGRAFGEATFGATKAKQMSELFRRMTGRVEASKVCLMIISQTRDRISGTFGRTYTRSGGRALDFYASIVVYLAHIKELTRTVNSIKRPIGVEVKAKATKNKIGLPFRSCTFPIIFGYGISDIVADLDWLLEHRRLDEVELTEKEFKSIRQKALHTTLPVAEERALRKKMARAVKDGWIEVETTFLPKHAKYG
jgi:recombination protein RecA